MRMRAWRLMLLLTGAFMFVLAGIPLPASAQTPYIPYFGKNRVHYDKFEWHIYKTDHFEVYYYPELEKHLERVAAYAESAYQHISAELKHDLSQKVPLILFKTSSEFQENNIAGGEVPEGVLAFAEPERNRMVLPIDEPYDQLYDLITHELTHVFEFDIIPRGLGLMNNLPLWMDEGLADYMTGNWNPLDLMTLRDVAITDNVPKMSELESQPLGGRAPYLLGHATFEFIESKWGKDGLRQFLFSLRKSAIGGGSSAYDEALRLKPEEFDEQFDRYLKERFKPFRDKERPADYGRNLAPRPDRTPYVATVSIEPSPTGEILAAVVGNRRDYELDIILLSARDGRTIMNVTKGLDKDRGFEFIATAGGMRGNLVSWIGWSPVDDAIAYFARTEKSRTLIIQRVDNGKVQQQIDLKTIDAPESPAFSPDGKTIVFAGLQGAVGDLFTVELATGKLTNLTKDAIADYAPAYAPDGSAIVYTARISGNNKLFRLDLATGRKKQITFGTHDDIGPKFYDDHTIVFTSTATDPKVSLPAEVERNGHIPNVWSLDLKNGELRQLTDTVTGNVSPVVLRQPNGTKIGFVSYYKGENGIHLVSAEKPIAVVDSADFGSEGPLIDFAPPLSHTLLRDNIHKKGTFEKMTLAGRPPVGLGITSGGNFYGNTQLTFTDVLGDKQINFYAQSVAQYRTTALTYVNIERRLQYAIQGFSQDTFYFGTNAGILYDPILSQYVTDARELAQEVRSERGGTIFAIYPFNRYARVEMSGGYVHLSDRYLNDGFQQLAEQYQIQNFGRLLTANGHMLPLGISFIKETTVFREYGPVAGSTVRVNYEAAPHISNSWVSRQTVDIDGRYYLRLAANGVLALRFKGLKSWGANPGYLVFGGNSEMRGYQYLEFLGQKGFFANAELRFPMVEAMLTPFGVIGGLRGVVFFDVGNAAYNVGQNTFMSTNREVFTPLLGYQVIDVFGNVAPVFGQPVVVSGLRLVDGRASYGIGLESFLLGFPMHFDWSWKTLFNKDWENVLFGPYGGSPAFRKVKFSFWIGYDF
jgi:WD40 repeat protein